MTDKQLLEAAARAAGIALVETLPGYPLWIDGVGEWNPLESDGDALRLAVKLRVDMRHNSSDAIAYASRDATVISIVEKRGPDPYAATRRAIVRAAAAMAPKP